MSGTPIENNPAPALDEKEIARKSLSKKRIFGLLVAIDLCLAVLVLYEVLGFFIR